MTMNNTRLTFNQNSWPFLSYFISLFWAILNFVKKMDGSLKKRLTFYGKFYKGEGGSRQIHKQI